jgi:hypothetical protein
MSFAFRKSSETRQRILEVEENLILAAVAVSAVDQPTRRKNFMFGERD